MNRAHWPVALALIAVAAVPSAALAQQGSPQLPSTSGESMPAAESVPGSPSAAVLPLLPVQPPAPDQHRYSARRVRYSEDTSTAPPATGEARAAVDRHEPAPHRFLHGFRLGYNFTANYDERPRDAAGMATGQSLAQEFGMRSPHSFVIGYEIAYRMIGNSWLNVLLIANASVTGLEQSLFLPSANLLIGFEFAESFQVGVGMNIAPDPDKIAHMIVAAGWTPRVGNFYTPVHFYLIPDVDEYHRMGVTVGVTW